MNKKILGLAIDDEFTHFDMQGGDLISFGVVEVFDDFTLGRKYQGFCRPRSTKYFSEKAQAVHGISFFKADTFPEPRDTMIEFLQWLVPLKDQFPLVTIYWGAWNFDLKWIEETMNRCELYSSFIKAFSQTKENHINALKLAKKMLTHVPVPPGEAGKKGQYKLSNVADFYDIELDHHNSLSDADVTAQIYCKIMKKENIFTGELF